MKKILSLFIIPIIAAVSSCGESHSNSTSREPFLHGWDYFVNYYSENKPEHLFVDGLYAYSNSVVENGVSNDRKLTGEFKLDDRDNINSGVVDEFNSINETTDFSTGVTSGLSVFKKDDYVYQNIYSHSKEENTNVFKKTVWEASFRFKLDFSFEVIDAVLSNDVESLGECRFTFDEYFNIFYCFDVVRRIDKGDETIESIVNFVMNSKSLTIDSITTIDSYYAKVGEIYKEEIKTVKLITVNSEDYNGISIEDSLGCESVDIDYSKVVLPNLRGVYEE